MKERRKEEERQKKEQQRVKHEDNNTLKLNQNDRINLMFYAAADVFDLFIVLEITVINTQREKEAADIHRSSFSSCY